MGLRSFIGADDSRTRTIGRGTHARRPAGDSGFVPPSRVRLRKIGPAFGFWVSADGCAATGGGGGSAPKACPAEIGFVLPESTQPRRGGDRGPRVAPFAETGFVPPKSAQPRGGGDRGPGIAPSRRRGRALESIERPDCGFPPRQRPPLVAIEPHQPGGDVAGGGEAFDHDLRAHAADARDVDLRLGDAQRGSAARLGRALAGDPSRQVGGLRR
jgi:hypothetical protein